MHLIEKKEIFENKVYIHTYEAHTYGCLCAFFRYLQYPFFLCVWHIVVLVFTCGTRKKKWDIKCKTKQ